MSKKLVVSLFAGALLLPASAAFAAGVVSGVCSNCHTMHDSQNGTFIGDATQYDALLGADGCVGCHAVATLGNVGNTGKSAGTASIPRAPQVDDAASPLNGGYFANTGALNATAAALQHNVADLNNDVDTNMAGTTAPGGTFSLQAAASGPKLTCQGCHSQAGHHKTQANVYRLLTGTNVTVANVNYGGVDNRNATTYDAADMNGFCANCHGTFHTGIAGSVPGTFQRHPTDSVTVVNNAAQPSIVSITAATDTNTVVVGSGAEVMCISCHVPHGSANADLLNFSYAGNSAGDNTQGDGCETCHSYTNGM